MVSIQVLLTNGAWRHLPTVYLAQVTDLYQPGITKNMGLDLLTAVASAVASAVA